MTQTTMKVLESFHTKNRSLKADQLDDWFTYSNKTEEPKYIEISIPISLEVCVF